MMQLAAPMQNGCQKCVVQLDTKASGSAERGLKVPNPFTSYLDPSCARARSSADKHGILRLARELIGTFRTRPRDGDGCARAFRL
jgi:hypothetical protein